MSKFKEGNSECEPSDLTVVLAERSKKRKDIRDRAKEQLAEEARMRRREKEDEKKRQEELEKRHKECEKAKIELLQQSLTIQNKTLEMLQHCITNK